MGLLRSCLPRKDHVATFEMSSNTYFPIYSLCLKPMRIFFAFTTILSFFLFSCKKESFTDSPDARLVTGVDTLKFDTVFTSVGSVTQGFTIVNDNDKKLRISQIKLGGGSTSSFSINVDGVAGTSFGDIEMNANDSIYVFVKVTIDPTAANAPFVIEDSIEINFNGNTSKVYLQAYGQNARFINGGHINTNTVWDNKLPYVILNSLTIDKGVILTLEKGTKVYCHATAPIIVNGTLKAMGDSAEVNRVIFRGDRLDPDYIDLPAGWPGILFSDSSRNNELNYTNILNAYQAVVVAGGITLSPVKLTLNQCIIDNAYDVGLYAINASVSATNCLISQCGNDGQPGSGGSNLILTVGGKYVFNHCTFVTYANLYQNHKQPVVYISNTDGTSTASLDAQFVNSIIYGQGGLTEDELVVKSAPTDNVLFTNVLYKVKNDPAAVFTDCIKNEYPQFDSVNTSRQEYNFRLKDISPAIDAGRTSSVIIDLDGNPRPVGIKPDMGCYERQ